MIFNNFNTGFNMISGLILVSRTPRDKTPHMDFEGVTLCRSKPIFGLLPPPLRNHTLNVKFIWLKVTFQLFNPRVASPSPRGQANPSRFFVWVTGFVLPWTHQESGASSRPVVRLSFARVGTHTSLLTLTLSPIKVRTSQ
ncbi:hypothetical protein Hanom_Chr07g00669831 [Helianthus anomalus]